MALSIWTTESNKSMDPIPELRNGYFKEKYEIFATLGSGGMGSVVKVRDKSNGSEHAIKVVAKNGTGYEQEQMCREIIIQRYKLNHPNIVKYTDAWEENYLDLPRIVKNEVCVFFKDRYSWRLVNDDFEPTEPVYCLFMLMKVYTCNLDELLRDQDRKKCSWILNKNICPFQSLIKALKYSHELEPAYIHRYLIKPQNILYDQDNDILAITDFVSMSPVLGTGSLYTAPEQWSGNYSKYSVYIHPMGIILYRMIWHVESGQVLRQIIEKLKKNISFSPHIKNVVCQLCARMVVSETKSQERPSLNVMFSEQLKSLIDSAKRCELVQQQLVLMLHAYRCMQRKEQNYATVNCQLPHCRTMKNALNHMKTCFNGRNCTIADCESIRLFIRHWEACSRTRTDCLVCQPFKQENDQREQQAQQQMLLQIAPGSGQVNQEPMLFRSIAGGPGQMGGKLQLFELMNSLFSYIKG